MGEREEVRLALVMNGGVSLAVWMGGVTHELDLLTRAANASASDDPGPSADRKVREHWASLCEARNVRVVIDVVAGTSAGGLNDAVLAACLARGTSIPPQLRDAWRTAAALTPGALLKDQERPQSLLNGSFFADKITEIFVGIGQAEGMSARPVTLFLTATALGGGSGTGLDSAGSEFTFEDHRRLYRFMHDPGRLRFTPDDDATRAFPPDPRTDFHTAAEALSRAARASASFPLAFEPVDERPLLPPANGGWGPEGLRVLPGRAANPPAATMLMDGGVLDNAPFGPVIEEIATRPVDARYSRILAYIVPTSDTAEDEADPAARRKQMVDPVHVAGQAIQLPREVDFRTDVQALRDYLAAVAEPAHRSLYVRMRDDVDGDRATLTTAAQALIAEYRQSRAVQGIWEARAALTDDARQLDLRGHAPIDASQVLTCDPRWLPRPDASVNPWTPNGTWDWGLTTARQVLLMMLRDPQEQLSTVADRQGPGEPLRFTDPAATGRKLSGHLAKIRAIEEEMSRRLARVAHDSTSEAGAVQRSWGTSEIAGAINTIFDDLQLSERLGELLADAANVYVAGLASDVPYDKGVEPAAQVVSWALAADILVRTFAPPSTRRPAPALQFLRIGPDVSSPMLPAYDTLGGHKLYGTRVNHFGAFADERARASDWLWGRLDAAAHLTKLLMPDATDKQLANEIRTVQELIIEAEATSWPGPAITPSALTDRLNKDCDLLSRADSTLVDAFLNTHTGADTAAAVARAALRLVTSYGATEIKPWQETINALLAQQRPETLSRTRRILRGLTSSPRRSFWSAVRKPRSLPRRMRNVLTAWAVGVSATAFLGTAALGIAAGAGTTAEHPWIGLAGTIPLIVITLALIWFALALITTGWHRWALRLFFTALMGAAAILYLTSW